MNGTVVRTLGCVALLALPAGGARGQRVGGRQAAEGVAIPYTETHTLHSRIVGADYQIYVRLPSTYGSTTALFPVLYSTDANRSFGIIAGPL